MQAKGQGSKENLPPDYYEKDGFLIGQLKDESGILPVLIRPKAYTTEDLKQKSTQYIFYDSKNKQFVVDYILLN